jgi:hypothetical protein
MGQVGGAGAPFIFFQNLNFIAMKEQITEIQEGFVNEAKKSIEKDFFESVELVKSMRKAITQAIAEGKRFVNTTGIPSITIQFMRYYQACQLFVHAI